MKGRDAGVAPTRREMYAYGGKKGTWRSLWIDSAYQHVLLFFEPPAPPGVWLATLPVF